MFYDDKYSYYIVDDYYFNSCCLNSNKKVEKYILIFYRDNEQIKSIKVKEYDKCKKLNLDIIVKYYIEEIDIKDIPFESEYNYSFCFNIKNIGYIKKVICNTDDFETNDNEKLKKQIDYYDKNWKSFGVDDKQFLNEQL